MACFKIMVKQNDSGSIRKQLKLPSLPPKVQIPVAVRMLERFGKDIRLCPKCNRGKLMLISIHYGYLDMQLCVKSAAVDNDATTVLAPP